jgi:hypothetical protein
MNSADSNSSNEQERLAAHYSSMDDSELFNISRQPWALSEAAWEALEDELDHRHLEPPEPDLPPQIVTPEKRNLVLLRRFRDIPEALLAKGRLESSGMECFLADDNMVRMDWFISNLLGGVKLFVDASDFSQAAKILNEPIPLELEVEGIGEYVQPRCPQCGSLDTTYAELKKVSYASAWLGLALPLQRDDWKCAECGHTWRDSLSDDAFSDDAEA